MAPPQIVNREQRAAWNGPEGAHWAEVSERRVAHADLSAPLLDAVRIERADAVLDVGCGIGEMTMDAARRAADGSATGIDLSELMIDRARISAAFSPMPPPNTTASAPPRTARYAPRYSRTR